MALKKYVSRAGSRAALVLFVACIALVLLGKAANDNLFLFLSLVLLIPAAAVMLRTNRCPYCGETFRGLHWSKPTAGYCKKCGKLMEFDDSARDGRGPGT